MKKILMLAVALIFMGAAAVAGVPDGDAAKAKEQLKKFVPVKLIADTKNLTAKEKKMLPELVSTANYMNDIFLRQVYANAPQLIEKLKKGGKDDAVLLDYYMFNKGPYDRLDHDKTFINSVGERPAGANFYPADMTKEEFETWVKKHPEDKAAFESGYTVIRRKGKDLVAVPYSEEYREFLEPAAAHLKAAAELCDNESLKKYLKSRADAFLSNDYTQSEMDWVRVKNSKFDVQFGPTEVYEDTLFAYKNAFQGILTLADFAETESFSKLSGFAPEFQKNLPVSDEFKGTGKNLESPIFITNAFYIMGESDIGIPYMGFNLPNDEKIRKEVGSKNVIYKNSTRAKFEKIMMPMTALMMDTNDVKDIDFDAFFAHLLLHEISHGLGPNEIMRNGKFVSTDMLLKELKNPLEEVKADALSNYNIAYLIGKGFYPKKMEKALWPTVLATLFRSIRFGINETYGRSALIQFNYLFDKGAITYNAKTGLYGVDRTKFPAAARDMAHDLVMIKANGNYDAAKKFVEKYGMMKPELEKALAKLAALPVDFRGVYEYK